MGCSLGELFISCSDDQTFRVYQADKDFKLLYVENTHFVKEWHTLTYLALEKGGRRVAITSQSGYLFIYDLKEKRFEYWRKVHMGKFKLTLVLILFLGSIEGLEWK